MIDVSRCFFLCWRLRRVVRDLPRRIAEAYGTWDRCTFGQARRVIGELHLSRFAVPYAFVAVCRLRG